MTTPKWNGLKSDTKLMPKKDERGRKVNRRRPTVAGRVNEGQTGTQGQPAVAAMLRY